MYNKEKVKEGLKKIRCIYKDSDPNIRFTVYTGTYAGWSWSLVVSDYEVIEKYDLWRKSYDFDYPAKNQ